MMAEQADDQEIIHTYTGGQDVVPRNATHVRVHKSVKVIPSRAFFRHPHLVEFLSHDGVETIEGGAFCYCPSLKRVKMSGVKNVEANAFYECEALTNVDCDELETIGRSAFFCCKSLRSMNLPSTEIVEEGAFFSCDNLVDLTFGDKLESIGEYALKKCPSLTRVTIPLKDGMITHDEIFQECRSLSCVDLVGGIHATIAALHLEEWRDEMKAEIGRINQVLPNTDAGTSFYDGGKTGEKARVIRMWISSVLHKMKHYKAEHRTLMKEATTTLELALWKSRLVVTVPVEGDENWRAECRNNCGAQVVIPNVLSFLEIKEPEQSFSSLPTE